MENKKELIVIIVSGILFVAGLLIPDNVITSVFFVLAYLVAGLEVLIKAVKSIVKGRVFSEAFLMSLATVGAICIGEYHEAVLVMLLYNVGEFLQDLAVDRSRDSIAELMSIRPDTATVLRNGVEAVIDPTEAEVCDIMLVKAGERIALDGIVISGTSELDCMAITGESLPVSVAPKDSVISGCINLSGTLTVRVTKSYNDSAVGRILALIEDEQSKKSKHEGFVERFASIYTPAVCIAAVIIGLIVPLILHGALSTEWLYRALSFLVASCPCALVISVPLAFYCGMGGASRSGILFKGSSAIESLAKVTHVALDKTGTVTEGRFSVCEVLPVRPEYRDTLIATTVALERCSNHPIAQSVCRELNTVDVPETVNVKEVAGRGITAEINGTVAFAGNAQLMSEHGIVCNEYGEVGTVHVALGGEYLGCISVADSVKANAAETISTLKKSGVREVIMLTGDRYANAERVAHEVGIDSVRAELLPHQKVEEINSLKACGDAVAFVGDGINDAPVLTAADVGIAMGCIGSDAAVEAADAVILHDDLAKVPAAMNKACQTMRIVLQNIVLSLVIKACVIVLCAVGLAEMWTAVIADVGITLLAVVNSLRGITKC